MGTEKKHSPEHAGAKLRLRPEGRAERDQGMSGGQPKGEAPLEDGSEDGTPLETGGEDEISLEVGQDRQLNRGLETWLLI